MPGKLALLNDRLYVNAALVNQAHLEAYTHRYMVKVTEPVGSGKACGNCKYWMKPWMDHGKQEYCHLQGYEETDVCKDFEPRMETREIEYTLESYKKTGSVYAFARGDIGKLVRTFPDFDIVDERVAPKIGYDLRFTSQLREDQMPIVRDWLRKGYGIIKSPTGSGKSVLLAHLIGHLGLRTLILSHETRHLDTLYQRICEHTNLLALEEETGQQIAGRFLEGKGDFPLMFSTFQAFGSEQGKAALSGLKDRFGLVWVDECHHVSAPTYHTVFSSFNSQYRGGTTATPTRKDQTHWATYNSIGPITAEGGSEMLKCNVTWIRTGISVPASLFRFTKYAWSRMLDWLGQNSDLKQQLLENVLRDIEAGYKPLVICERRALVSYMERMLTHSGYNVEVIVGGQAKKKSTKANKMGAAVDFDALSRKLLDGTVSCVIGTNVLNENIDIRPLDCLHLPFPSANPEMEEQRAGRIRRPLHKDDIAAGFVKNNPEIRSYCFEGHRIASAGETTRKAVYERLGFTGVASEGTPKITTKKRLSLND